MLGVMVVDKQRQMYAIYRNMLHWEQYGFEILTYCDSEAKAVEYFCEYRHDLVISDVKLRQGDGISLLKQLKAYDPNCHVILCSYESDPLRMREAWRSGCMDYLIKGMLKNSQVIENLQMICSKRLHGGSVALSGDWRNELQRQLGRIRDHQDVHKEELLDLLRREELACLQAPYPLLGFRMDDVKLTFGKGLYRDRGALQASLREVIEDTLRDRLTHQILFSKMHSGVIIVEAMTMPQLQALCEELVDRFWERLQLHVSMTISDRCIGEQQFYDTYMAIAERSYARFYLGNGCVQQLDRPSFRPLKTQGLTYKEGFLRLSGSGAMTQIRQLCEEMMETMAKQAIDPEDVVFYCRSIIHAIEHQKLRHAKADAPPILAQGTPLFDKAETLPQLQKEFLAILEEIEEWIQTYSDERYSRTVSAVLAYVDEHLDEKITLEQLAATLERTPVHISRIFKKQTGEQLIQYINRRKMQEAAELMEHTDMKIKEIAAAVGMKDQLYFNKVFHRFYQVSPREYRNRL